MMDALEEGLEAHQRSYAFVEWVFVADYRSPGISGTQSTYYVFFSRFPYTAELAIAGAILAFLISFDELAMTIFLTSPTLVTLPVQIFTYVEWHLDPGIAALATLLLAKPADAGINVQTFTGRVTATAANDFGVRVVCSGKVYGTLCCFSQAADESLTAKDLQKLECVARITARRIDIKQAFVFHGGDELSEPLVELHQQKAREGQAGIQQPLDHIVIKRLAGIR